MCQVYSRTGNKTENLTLLESKPESFISFLESTVDNLGFATMLLHQITLNISHFLFLNNMKEFANSVPKFYIASDSI